jgi:hypothetical protein
MRAPALVSLFFSGLVSSGASVGKEYRDAADTTVRIVNTVNAKALVVDAGMGTGMEASGDLAVRANGSRVGLRAEADYIGIEAVARNGTAIVAAGSGAGLQAQGGSTGVLASGEHMGLVATATQEGAVGVKGTAAGARGIGVWGGVGAQNADNRGSAGVAGQAFGNGASGVSGIAEGRGGAGILGMADGAQTAAGFFHGDVYVTGQCSPCTPADARLQKNVREVSGALAKVMALKPRTYEPEAGALGDRILLPGGRRYGFSAQEVQGVVPEAVREVRAPARQTTAEQWNSTPKEAIAFKAMNYDELIPLLVRAIQEQQKEIEALKKRP